jgi:hypothetical protein
MGKLIKFHIAGVKKHKPLLGVKIIPRFCLYEKKLLCARAKVNYFLGCFGKQRVTLRRLE